MARSVPSSASVHRSVHAVWVIRLPTWQHGAKHLHVHSPQCGCLADCVPFVCPRACVLACLPVPAASWCRTVWWFASRCCSRHTYWVCGPSPRGPASLVGAGRAAAAGTQASQQSLRLPHTHTSWCALRLVAALPTLPAVGVAGIAFPLPIMALVPLRLFVLPRVFERAHLSQLDAAEYEEAPPVPDKLRAAQVGGRDGAEPSCCCQCPLASLLSQLLSGGSTWSRAAQHRLMRCLLHCGVLCIVCAGAV